MRKALLTAVLCASLIGPSTLGACGTGDVPDPPDGCHAPIQHGGGGGLSSFWLAVLAALGLGH